MQKSWGKKGKEKEALELLIPKRTWLDGAVSGLRPSCRHPEPKLGPCPGIGVGGRAGTRQQCWGGGLWVVAKPQRCSFALCPELFRQRCCRGWSLPPACPWAHHEPPLVPVSGRSGRHGALASAARQRPVGLPGRPNLPPQPARCPLPSSNLMAQARGSATKAA